MKITGNELKDTYVKQFKKKKKVLSPTEERKRAKTKLIEDLKKLDITGGENERAGIRAIQEEVKETNKAKRDVVQDEMTWLEKRLHRSDREYLVALGGICYRMMGEIDWLIGWKYDVRVEDRFITLLFKDHLGRLFAKGLRASGDVKKDYLCARRLVEEAENTVEEIVNGRSFNRTKEGIYLS